MDVPASFAGVVADQTAVENSVSANHRLPAFSQGDDSPSFKDILDTINPLQHLPIISTVYRELTGDQPGSVARVVGGALYGGPIGLAYEMVNSAIDNQTGKDVGGHTWAMLMDDTTDQSVQMASADVPKQDAVGTAAAAVSSAAAPVSAAATTPVAAAPAAPAADTMQLIAQEPAAPVAAEPLQPAKLEASAEQAKVQTASAAGTAAGQALPAGFMPTPPRRIVPVVPPTPPNAILSTSNQRSNMPNAGHPRSNYSQTDARGIAVTQSGSTPVAVQAVATPPAPTPPPNAWLPDAMSKALDKYERTSKLGQTAPAPVAEQPAP